MSTQSFINRASLAYLQKNAGKYLLGANLVSIQLAKPEIAGKRTLVAGKLATKENHEESLENLQESALLEFTFTIVSPVTYTSHKHKLLALQNQTAQEMSDTFRIYANLESIELERDSFLGTPLIASEIHSLIRDYVKLGKSQKAINKWRKSKGTYQVKRNGEFLPYEAPQVNLAPKIETPLIKSEASETPHGKNGATKPAMMHQTEPRAKAQSKKEIVKA